MALPLSLQQLLQATEYPPEAPTLMFNSTTKVVMIVSHVSPTPFALLRRAKNFEYRNDDAELQAFSNYEDPLQSLTDECRRVLKCISSTNQSSVSSSKASTSLRDASWSRFEDIGFGGTAEESDDELENSVVGRKQNGRLQQVPHSANDIARPTTPSWADFLSSGFVDESSKKSSAPLLLPPDKVLPPIQTTRGYSSQSHRRDINMESSLEPGELASINSTDLDDAFWWVWMSSLAGEEPTSRKAVFGRCALIETVIPGGKWLIMEEQVKGAAPEPGPGARIVEKKGFFGFSTRRGKLSRRKSDRKKNQVIEEPYNQDTSFPLSKSTIGPDQHARIQAAAAALQEKNKQAEESTTPTTNGLRRGRHDDAMSTRTASVFTLQPMIMNEASSAMKWANQYDKNEIRTKYLGDNLAGRGASTEMLTLPPNGINRSASPLSNRSVSRSERNRELPPTPREVKNESSTDPRAGSERREQLSPAVKSEPMQPPPKVPLENTRPLNVEATEAAEIPLPDAPAPEVSSPAPELVKTVTQSPGNARPSEDGTRDAHKKLQKKPRPAGIKGIFGRKKTVKTGQPSPKAQQPNSPESDAAVAAARAALEGQTSPKAKSSPSPTQMKAPTSRFSTVPRKQRPVDAEPSEPGIEAATPTPVQRKRQNEAKAAPNDQPDTPTANTYPDGRPITDRDDEYDQLSRVSTHEREDADREFSRFDQGPLTDQPAFVSADPHHLSEIPSLGHAEEDQSYHGEIPSAETGEEIHDEGEDSGQQISPVQSRWAQIRRTAAEHAAARQSEEQSRAPTEQTDDGETSGEESKFTMRSYTVLQLTDLIAIESRVARIKARVAELTGNMESARH
ncbi:MAG: hypothetical protein Q9160_004908 [Pyrenula sp. 1 TL-2023]